MFISTPGGWCDPNPWLWDDLDCDCGRLHHQWVPPNSFISDVGVRRASGQECLAWAQSGDRRTETWAAWSSRRPSIALKSRLTSETAELWKRRRAIPRPTILWCSEVKCQTIYDAIMSQLHILPCRGKQLQASDVGWKGLAWLMWLLNVWKGIINVHGEAIPAFFFLLKRTHKDL